MIFKNCRKQGFIFYVLHMSLFNVNNLIKIIIFVRFPFVDFCCFQIQQLRVTKIYCLGRNCIYYEENLRMMLFKLKDILIKTV